MSPTGRRRNRWSVSSIALPGLLLLAAAVGFGLVASSLGWLDPQKRAPAGAPPGTVAVPAAAVAIPTYTRVGLEHLFDPATNDLRAVYLPEGSLFPETIVDPVKIVGRVLATDKKPGQLFTEEDFFPPGTREGIVAGIPRGKRAVRIDASKVNGIVGLGRGDRFDLVATLDFARGSASGVRVEGASANQLGAFGSQVRASTIVEGGAVVQPLMRRAVVGGGSQQLVEEMVVAVDPGEVAALTEALHSGARLDCIPRSGRPIDVSAESRTPAEAKKDGGIHVIETISGGKRRVVAVPAAPEKVSRNGKDEG